MVGLLEEREAAMEYLEWKFPHIFTGYKEFMTMHYNKKDSRLDSKSGDDDILLRTIYCKKRPHDCSLYEFIKNRFHSQLRDMRSLNKK